MKDTVKKKRLVRAAQTGLFLVAGVLFYIGLGLGLQVNTTLGNIGVGSAFVVGAVAAVWTIRSNSEKTNKE